MRGDGPRDGVVAVLFEVSGEDRQLFRPGAGESLDSCHGRFPRGDGAGLVENHVFNLAGVLERGGGLKEQAVHQGFAGTGGYGHGRGQTEGARAADQQHGNREGESFRSGIAEHKAPKEESHHRDRDYRGHEHQGDPVAYPGDGGFAGQNLFYRQDDLAERGGGAGARRPAEQEPRNEDAGAAHRVAFPDVPGNRFAGQARFVHGARAPGDLGVGRNGFARPDDEIVAGIEIIGPRLLDAPLSGG